MSDPVWRKRVNDSLLHLGEIEKKIHLLTDMVKQDQGIIMNLTDRLWELEEKMKSQEVPTKIATPRKARKRPKKASSSPRRA